MRKRKQRNGGEKKIEGELGAIYAAGEAPLRSLRRPQSGSAPRSEHVRRENVVSLATRGMRNVEEFLRMESNSFSLSAARRRRSRGREGAGYGKDPCSRENLLAAVFCHVEVLSAAHRPRPAADGKPRSARASYVRPKGQSRYRVALRRRTTPSAFGSTPPTQSRPRGSRVWKRSM